jgi:hypothetical protein
MSFFVVGTFHVRRFALLCNSGRPYDACMVPEVVEVREDQGLPAGRAIIEETIAPTVTWRGQVIKPGQIIVKRSSARPQEHTKVVE